MTIKAPAFEGPDNTGLCGDAVLGLAAIAALAVANSPFAAQTCHTGDEIAACVMAAA